MLLTFVSKHLIFLRGQLRFPFLFALLHLRSWRSGIALDIRHTPELSFNQTRLHVQRGRQSDLLQRWNNKIASVCSIEQSVVVI